MPVTFLLSAGAARLLLNLDWHAALLLGAALSPTDPVLASSVVGEQRVPSALRRLLNVESGLNDGLSLPLVFFFLYWGMGEGAPSKVILAVLGGALLGLALPWLVFRIERLPTFAPSQQNHASFIAATALTLLALCKITGANEFIAAFVAGAVTGTMGGEYHKAFSEFGQSLGQLLKLGALFLFAGSDGAFELSSGLHAWVFALWVLFVARPLGMALSLWGSPLPGRQKAIAAWFGPKGFATALYALLILGSGARDAETLFATCGLVVTLSILLHSSTDTLAIRWMTGCEGRKPGAPGS